MYCEDDCIVIQWLDNKIANIKLGWLYCICLCHLLDWLYNNMVMVLQRA